jgi:hypothetical protein
MWRAHCGVSGIPRRAPFIASRYDRQNAQLILCGPCAAVIVLPAIDQKADRSRAIQRPTIEIHYLFFERQDVTVISNGDSQSGSGPPHHHPVFCHS